MNINSEILKITQFIKEYVKDDEIVIIPFYG